METSKPEIPTVLGKVVRTRRQQLGYSQEELAWRAGLNRTYVTDVERGARNLTLATIERLAEALQTPISRLLQDVDSQRGITSEISQNAPVSVNILFVEDNPRDVELTLRALRHAHLDNSIYVARNGAEALDYLYCTGRHANRTMNSRPQLVLLDLKLPGVHGLEVLRRMKSDPLTRSIPVVVLTSSDDTADFAEAKRLGAEAYIVKPVDFLRLSKVAPSLNFSWSLLRPPNASREREATELKLHME